MTDVYVHATAIVESETIGEGSRVWAYTHVLAGARVGSNCNIGDHCFLESGASVGDNVWFDQNGDGADRKSVN